MRCTEMDTASLWPAQVKGTRSERPPGLKPDARAASVNLVRLLERGLGYDEGHIDPIALRLFVTAYWKRVSKFAHDIHDGMD